MFIKKKKLTVILFKIMTPSQEKQLDEARGRVQLAITKVQKASDALNRAIESTRLVTLEETATIRKITENQKK